MAEVGLGAWLLWTDALMPGAGELARAARALQRQYGDLLRGEPMFHEPPKDRTCDAIDEARRRLQGGERPGKDQLSLDLHAR